MKPHKQATDADIQQLLALLEEASGEDAALLARHKRLIEPGTLSRFLTATNRDIEEGRVRVLNHLRWREAYGADDLASEDFSDMSSRNELYWHNQTDLANHPILVWIPARHTPSAQKPERMARFLCHLLERFTLDFSAEQFVLLVDCRELSRSNLDWELLQKAAPILENNYPERQAATYVLPVGTLATMTWRVIATFIDPGTACKIKLMPGFDSPALLEGFSQDAVADLQSMQRKLPLVPEQLVPEHVCDVTDDTVDTAAHGLELGASSSSPSTSDAMEGPSTTAEDPAGGSLEPSQEPSPVPAPGPVSPAPAVASPTVVLPQRMANVLLKQRDMIQTRFNWRERYFVFESDGGNGSPLLRYYKGKDQLSSQIKYIHLPGAKATRPVGMYQQSGFYSFHVMPKEGKFFSLASESEEVACQWVEVINAAGALPEKQGTVLLRGFGTDEQSIGAVGEETWQPSVFFGEEMELTSDVGELQRKYGEIMTVLGSLRCPCQERGGAALLSGPAKASWSRALKAAAELRADEEGAKRNSLQASGHSQGGHGRRRSSLGLSALFSHEGIADKSASSASAKSAELNHLRLSYAKVECESQHKSVCLRMLARQLAETQLQLSAAQSRIDAAAGLELENAALHAAVKRLRLDLGMRADKSTEREVRRRSTLSLPAQQSGYEVLNGQQVWEGTCDAPLELVRSLSAQLERLEDSSRVFSPSSGAREAFHLSSEFREFELSTCELQVVDLDLCTAQERVEVLGHLKHLLKKHEKHAAVGRQSQCSAGYVVGGVAMAAADMGADLMAVRILNDAEHAL
ncbi:unnamed protein product [Chrysoparadoxa australica]